MKNGILQKKKFIKKIVLAFLSLFIVVQSHITNVHALSNVITYNNYGSFEWSNVNFDLGIGNVNYGGCVLTGNLNQYYSGTVRLNFSGYNSVNFGVMLTEGVHISNYGTNFIELTLNGVNYFQLGLVRTQANINALSFNSFSNWNLWKIDSLNMIYEVQKIRIDVGSMLTAINGIKNNTQHIEDIYLDTHNILANTQLIGQYLNSISTKLDKIDNIIDTITWSNQNKTFRFEPTLNNEWTTIGKSLKVYINEYTVSNNTLFKLRLPIQVQSNIGEEMFVEFFNDNNKVETVNYYITNEYTGSYLYFWGRLNMNNNFYIKIYTTYANLRTTNINSYSPQLLSIDSNDIEYWQLLGYFHQYLFYKQQNSYNKTIIEKLTELINKQTDIVIKDEDKKEVNTNINNYNNVMTDINGVEINFKNEFNSSNQSIQTQNLTPSQNIQNSRIILGGVFNQFLDEFAFLKTWLILLLICAIALILLGH